MEADPVEGQVEGVIKQSSGCDGMKEVARVIVNYFRDSSPVVAKYAGLWLKANNCRQEEVLASLYQNTGRPVGFLKAALERLLCPSEVYGKDLTECRRQYLVPLLVHYFLGEVPVRLMKELPEWLNGRADDYYRNNVAPWLAGGKEGLVEEAIGEHLKELVSNTDVIKEYFYKNKKFKKAVHDVERSLSSLFIEFKVYRIRKEDVEEIKNFIGYDDKIWSGISYHFCDVLKGWVSQGGDRATASKYEWAIRASLLGVLREFLKEKLFPEDKEVDRQTLDLLLRLAFRVAVKAPAQDLYDEAGQALREYLFTEDREVPASIRFAVHGYPAFVNGLFSEGGVKKAKIAGKGWCDYLDLPVKNKDEKSREIAAGTALYLASDPPSKCKDKIGVWIVRALNESRDSVYIIGVTLTRYLRKVYYLDSYLSHLLSVALVNTAVAGGNPGFLRAVLHVAYDRRNNIPFIDKTVKKIFAINVVRGLLILDDESVVEEAKNLLNLDDRTLIYYQAGLASDLMSFYLSKREFYGEAQGLAQRMEGALQSLENINWDEVALQLDNLEVELDKAELKEGTKYGLSIALEKYYHTLYDVSKEKKYADAQYDAVVERYGGEEQAKAGHPNNYFLALLSRDALDAVLAGDLRGALERLTDHSEEAFEHSRSIIPSNLRMFAREYLIASAYLGRLDMAAKAIDGDPDLSRAFWSMDSLTLLGIFSLLYYLTGGKFIDKVAEFLKQTAEGVKLTPEGQAEAERILKDAEGDPLCGRALSELQGALVDDMDLSEAEAQSLARILVATESGVIALLSLSRAVSGMEVAKGLAKCLAKHKGGALADLLSRAASASSEEGFRDALVRLAVYLM